VCVYGKVHFTICHEGTEGENRSSYSLSLTFALDEGGWVTPRSAPIPPGMTLYSLYRRPSRPQGRSGRARKSSPPRRFDIRTVQPATNRYTEPTCVCMNPTHTHTHTHIYIYIYIFATSKFVSVGTARTYTVQYFSHVYIQSKPASSYVPFRLKTK